MRSSQAPYGVPCGPPLEAKVAILYIGVAKEHSSATIVMTNRAFLKLAAQALAGRGAVGGRRGKH
jgi:hypothetical protein